jgi:hypothetical protein
MKEVMGNLYRDTVAKACRRFRSRIEAVVAANGDFFNRMLDDDHGFLIFLN